MQQQKSSAWAVHMARHREAAVRFHQIDMMSCHSSLASAA